MAAGGVYVVLLLLCAAVELSAAATHLVGDSSGWTIGPNYTKWSSANTFGVGDTLVFKYDKSTHNVMEVKEEDYESCKVDAPIKVYKTGNDEIAIKSTGDHYFICGFPGHCQAGQKVEIVVPQGDSDAPAPSTAQSPSVSATNSTSSSPTATPKSNGASRIQNSAGLALASLAIAAISILIIQ